MYAMQEGKSKKGFKKKVVSGAAGEGPQQKPMHAEEEKKPSAGKTP
jgi:hypothetical protein